MADEVTVKLGKATAVIVAGLRHGGDTDDAIRRKVTDAFREAVAGHKPWLEDMQFPDRPAPEPCFTTAGIYRYIFEREGVDRTDQIRQESMAEVVRKALERELKGKQAG